jgi:hypothetical protein
MTRQDATATLANFWRTVEEVKIIDDYQVVFRMKRPLATRPYAASRSGDLLWEYPGPGAGRTTHFHLLQAAQ